MTPQHYTTTALVPVANALRGVAAGYVTADTTTGLRPTFLVHGLPVADDSIDGQVLHALHELGITTLTVALPDELHGVALAELPNPRPAGRSISVGEFTINAQRDSFDRTSELVKLMNT